MGTEFAVEKSLWQRRWQRWRKNRLAFAGLWFLGLLAVVAIFADFLSPYDPGVLHPQFTSAPPMLLQLRLRDADTGRWGLYVNGLTRARNPFTSEWVYLPDPTQTFAVRLFSRGDPYRLLGLIKTDVHLFGVGTEPESAGQLFLFGTDRWGRDLLSRILMGARISLGLGPLVVLISFLLGTWLGAISGYWGGAIDTAIQRVAEVFMTLPRLALLLAISAAAPPDWGAVGRLWLVVALLAGVGWAPVARIVRGQFLALREEEFVLAARASGARDWRVITRHLLPNTLSYILVAATLTIPQLMILESLLSFLNFGIQPPLVSWGMLLQGAQSVSELQFHPWVLLPGVFIALTVLAFNIVGDALRDAVDPRLTV